MQLIGKPSDFIKRCKKCDIHYKQAIYALSRNEIEISIVEMGKALSLKKAKPSFEDGIYIDFINFEKYFPSENEIITELLKYANKNEFEEAEKRLLEYGKNNT